MEPEVITHLHTFLNTPSTFDIQKLANFLSNPNEHWCVIRIWHPKIVQRSYGKEKRFFCPPPLIAISGLGWVKNRENNEEKIVRYRSGLRTVIERLTTGDDANKLLEHYNKTPDMPLRRNCNIGLNDGTIQFVTTIEEEMMARSLFISSVDKRRYFKLAFQITEYFGPTTCYPYRTIGNFDSADIRVVSKPPKKQTIRAQDSLYVCLKSGMQIALFNRVRSQAIATRYLHVEGYNFVGSQDKWSAFYIFAVDTDQPFDDDVAFHERQGFVNYGNVVRLVDVITGVSTPNLILRKIEKDGIQVTPVPTNEPVAQLQRVAFQLCNSASSYWSISDNSIIQQECLIIGPTSHEILDSASWTLANAEFVEYKFYEISEAVTSPVTPIPLVKKVQLESAREDQAVIELCGTDLGPHLTVFFGLCPAVIISSYARYIRCRVPSLVEATSFIDQGYDVYNSGEGFFEVPIILIRNDGVIYPTPVSFQYSCFAAGEIGKIIFKPAFDGAEGEIENDNVFTDDDEDGDSRVPDMLSPTF